MFKEIKEANDKDMDKIEAVLVDSNDYTHGDLRVVLEAIHVQQTVQQALINTYALRHYLKELDPEEHLPLNRLKTMQQ